MENSYRESKKYLCGVTGTICASNDRSSIGRVPLILGGPDNLRGRGVCATWHPPLTRGGLETPPGRTSNTGNAIFGDFWCFICEDSVKNAAGEFIYWEFRSPPRDWLNSNDCTYDLLHEIGKWKTCGFLVWRSFCTKKEHCLLGDLPGVCNTGEYVPFLRGGGRPMSWIKLQCNQTIPCFCPKGLCDHFWLPFILFKFHLFCMLFCHTLEKKHHIWWCISSTPIQAFIAKMAWNG